MDGGQRDIIHCHAPWCPPGCMDWAADTCNIYITTKKNPAARGCSKDVTPRQELAAVETPRQEVTHPLILPLLRVRTPDPSTGDGVRLRCPRPRPLPRPGGAGTCRWWLFPPGSKTVPAATCGPDGGNDPGARAGSGLSCPELEGVVTTVVSAGAAVSSGWGCTAAVDAAGSAAGGGASEDDVRANRACGGEHNGGAVGAAGAGVASGAGLCSLSFCTASPSGRPSRAGTSSISTSALATTGTFWASCEPAGVGGMMFIAGGRAGSAAIGLSPPLAAETLSGAAAATGGIPAPIGISPPLVTATSVDGAAGADRCPAGGAGPRVPAASGAGSWAEFDPRP